MADRIFRNSQLIHPSGMRIETPMLIPSFSSKGFGISTKKLPGGEEVDHSEVATILEAASEFLTDSMLISAYDIYYQYIPMPENAKTDITVADSGGYETSDLQDLSCTFIQRLSCRDWDEEKHSEILAKWPEHIPAMFVSYDKANLRILLQDQISRAIELFKAHRAHLSTILVKPETRDQKDIQMENVIAHAERFGHFDVVGIAEKELEGSCLKRMEVIAKIRLALDDAGVKAPIHIFGSLDPISVPLYFLAGAEIFDGLTWLRFGYEDGCAMYRNNFAAKRRGVGIHRRDDFVKLKTMQDNLGFLTELTNQMRRFLIDTDYAKFGQNESIFREAFDLLKTRVRRVS